jgi:hypothetical protein
MSGTVSLPSIIFLVAKICFCDLRIVAIARVPAPRNDESQILDHGGVLVSG